MADMRSWSKAVIIELLALYKSFPCLWKIKSDEYKNKNLKKDAYNKLVEFCKEKGFHEANRDFVVKKIQSLRGSFRKELKKVRDRQRSGRGADEVYTSSLWYFNHLLFTKDQELPAGSLNNDDESQHGSSKGDESEYAIWTDEQGFMDGGTSDTEQRQIIVRNGMSSERAGVMEGGIGDNGQRKKAADILPSTPAPGNKRKAAPNYQDDVYEICADTLTTTNKDLSEFDLVGMNIAKKLAKMDPVQAIYAESIVNNVLRKGLLKQLTENTDLCDSNSGVAHTVLKRGCTNQDT